MDAPQRSSFVVRDADFLFERLREREQVEKRPAVGSDYDDWRKRFQFGNKDLFARRLASLGITEEEARILSERRNPGPVPGVPQTAGWWELLKEAVRFVPTEGLLDEQIPFAPLWEPLARFAADRAFASSPKLDRPAKDALIKQLAGEIARVAAEPFFLEFKTFREKGGRYEEFIKQTRLSYYEAVFHRWPALARCVGWLIASWIETTDLFLTRLTSDWKVITELLETTELKLITGIEPGLSDRHEGGFQALCLTFDDTHRLLYKPKDFSLEAGLPKINQWLQSQAAPFQFRFPATVDRGNYGWAEFILHQELTSRAQVQEYYRRAGRLLALAYLLNARDLLVDNIISSGTDPVPIDLETFFQGELQSGSNYGRKPNLELPEKKQFSSVMDTGFLPIWQVSGIKAEVDLSGLAGNKETVAGLTRVGWKGVNSDAMEFIREPVTAPPARNKVIWNSQVEQAADHAEEVRAGFGEFFRFALEHKDSLLAALDLFSEMRGRTIYRSTALYAQLIKDSLSEANLVSGLKRSFAFERLYRPFILNDKLTGPIKSLLDAEIERLSFLDIPRLYVTLGSDQLEIENGPAIEHAFWEPPLTTVRRRIQNADLLDLPYHEENIRESLKRKPLPELSELSGDKCLELANELAEQIIKHQQRSGYLWALPSFAAKTHLPAVERLSLYSGDLGILVFLFSVHKLNGLPIEELGTKFLDQWLNSLPEPSEALGICTGTGSLIYSGVLLYRLTGNERWLEWANRAASMHTVELLQSCAEPDLTSGISGLMLSLVSLFQITGETSLKVLAQSCLIELGNRFNQGWSRPDALASFGFAHGSAGIAFAAARYSEQTGDDLGEHLANQAIAFDRQFYSDSSRNWPVSVDPNSGFMNAWCSGLPGILLSRSFIGRITGDPIVKDELERGIPDLINYFSGMDHWCCGNLGIAEILCTLAEQSGQESLRGFGRELIRKTINRARSCAFYRFSPSLGENYCFQPSLFRGTAGLGYSLLRASGKVRLPAIVGFEI